MRNKRLSFYFPSHEYTFMHLNNKILMEGLIITVASKLTLQQNKVFKKLCNEKQITRSEMIRQILVKHINKNQKQ